MSQTGASMCYESMVTCVYKVMTLKKRKKNQSMCW